MNVFGLSITRSAPAPRTQPQSAAAPASLPIMQEARRTRLASAKTAFEMGVPFNEVNRVLDLGFKPLPWGDTGFLSSNITPVTSKPPQPKF
jgi:hypothetical protein